MHSEKDNQMKTKKDEIDGLQNQLAETQNDLKNKTLSSSKAMNDSQGELIRAQDQLANLKT